MLQADPAGRVRLKLIVRTEIFPISNHRRLSRFLRSYLEDRIRICQKNLGTTLNMTPEVVTKNLGTVQNSTPKHVACPEYVMYWKIPQVILRSMGKYRTDRCIEISDFLKTKFSYLTIGEYGTQVYRDIHVFDMALVNRTQPQ